MATLYEAFSQFGPIAHFDHSNNGSSSLSSLLVGYDNLEDLRSMMNHFSTMTDSTLLTGRSVPIATGEEILAMAAEEGVVVTDSSSKKQSIYTRFTIRVNSPTFAKRIHEEDFNVGLKPLWMGEGVRNELVC